MIEVEIKLPVRNLIDIENKLMQMGFRVQAMSRETDQYYDTESNLIRDGGKALRIRKNVDLLKNTEENIITFKGQKLDQISMTRKELETRVLNDGIMKEIFCEMGYYAVPPQVTKTRKMLCLDDMHACLDQVEKLGSFLELEVVLETEEEREAALKRIEQILNQLGYKMNETSRTSYLSLLQGRED